MAAVLLEDGSAMETMTVLMDLMRYGSNICVSFKHYCVKSSST